MDRNELINRTRRSALFSLLLSPLPLIAQSSGSLSTRRGGGSGGNAYDVTFTYPGPIADAFTFPLIAFARAVNWLGNISGSTGNCGTNPTGAVVFNLAKNGTGIGTVGISTSGVFTFATSGGNPVTFAIGDVLQVQTPALDATLASVTMTLFGSV